MSVTNNCASGSETADESFVLRVQSAMGRGVFHVSDIWMAPIHDLPVRDEILYQYLRLSRDMNVLEIGPGSGFTAFRLSRLVKHILLIDVAAQSVAHLRDALREISNVSLMCADVCSPGLADSLKMRFDAIFGLETFEYLSNPGACLQNLASMLCKRGTLLLEFPNYPPPKSPGITHFRSRAELDELLRAAGFESWEIYALGLRPVARIVFRVLHEQPLRLIRALRNLRGGKRALNYDQTWTFRNQRRLEARKALLHSVWTLLIPLMRLGGDCFERKLLGSDILNHDLLVVASR